MINESINIVYTSRLLRLRGKEEEIIRTHLKDKIPVLELAKIYKCGRRAIDNIIKENGFDVSHRTSPALEGRESEILKMYVNDELTIKTISEIIGCSFNSIKNFLQRNNVKIRTQKESANTLDAKNRRPPTPLYGKFKTLEILNEAIKLYQEDEWDFCDLGKKYGMSHTSVQDVFRRNNVKLRTQKENNNTTRYRNKVKQAFIKNYGVENPMQDPTIFKRSNTNRYRFKTHERNGRLFTHLQGFEPQGIDYLIDVCSVDVNDISTGNDVPTIRYKHGKLKKVYHPDLFIPKQNQIIEIKCRYTYENQLELNISKRNGSLAKGYKYKTIIFNNLGTEIEEIID